MSAVTVLLIVLVGAINVINKFILDSQTNVIMSTLVNSDGRFMQMDFHHRDPFSPPLDMDTMKAARFFVVKTSSDGKILDINTDQISSVNPSDAAYYASIIKNNSGNVDKYKYEVKIQGDEKLIFFMDTSVQTGNFIRVFALSTVLALICWFTVFLFVVFFSGHVVRPIIAGMEKQRQFITNAGHELKTPLAIIQSNNDAMTLIHGENKYNINIKAQTKRLGVLMSNLLTLAKIDEEAQFPTTSENISNIISEIVAGYRVSSNEKNILLNEEIEKDVQLNIHRDLFVQMISSLMDNAVKYTPQNGRIEVSLKRNGRKIIITEENTCCPNHETDTEKLFERFYSGDDSRTRNSELSGYGIGLSAARAIAESFGGTLSAEYTGFNTIRFTARFSVH